MMMTRTAFLAAIFGLAASVKASASFDDCPSRPYAEIDCAELFVVGHVESSAKCFKGNFIVWRVRLESVVKGQAPWPFLYVMTSPQYEKDPFGKGRGVGDKVFLALKPTGLPVPEEAKPQIAGGKRDASEALAGTCYSIPSFFSRYLNMSDAYFRCGIFYSQTRQEQFNTQAKLREAHKQLGELVKLIEKDIDVSDNSSPSGTGGLGSTEQGTPDIPAAVPEGLRNAVYDISDLVGKLSIWPGTPKEELDPELRARVEKEERELAEKPTGTQIITAIRKQTRGAWGPGTMIEERAGKLFVIQTPETHEKIAQVLSAIRKDPGAVRNEQEGSQRPEWLLIVALAVGGIGIVLCVTLLICRKQRGCADPPLA